jgi:hypothetical protein
VDWSQPRGNLISLGTDASKQATIAGDANGGLTVTPVAGQTFTVAAGASGGSLFSGTGSHVFGSGGNTVTMSAGKATLIAGATYSAINTGAFSKFANDQTGSNLRVGANGAGAILQGAYNDGAATLQINPFTGDVVFGATGATVTLASGAITATGKIRSVPTSATGYNQLYDTSGITTGRGAFAITSTGAGLAFGIESSVGGTSFAGSAAYSSYFGTSNATSVYIITNGVIRQTIDGSTGNATFAGSVAAAVAEYADNAAAVTAGLAVGTFYRTGDVLKVVH